MEGAVLALNAGSSSVKFALYGATDNGAPSLVARGVVEGLETSPRLSAKDAKGAAVDERRWPEKTAYHTLLSDLLEWVDAHLNEVSLIAVGHRVVHGGRGFTAPVRIDEAVMKALEALTPLAPLHQPHSLAPVRIVTDVRPGLPQVACFDTAFHHTMPPVAARYALPRALEDDGVRRYGFHGLSYEFIAGRLREAAPELAVGKVVVAHLGNGASLCALSNGRSIDTTMGFTALDGLIMGTRCGAIDPGVLLYLLQEKKLDPGALETLLYRDSGLLGVSGLSSDMRVLLDSADDHARDAVELFVYRVARETAALAGSLEGLDGFVFTGGIGEHAAEIRSAVCERLAWFGVVPDHEANAAQAGRISAAGSRVDVRVIPTDEEITIARHTLEILRAVTPSHSYARHPL
ncbi:acetate/propionate family kinase [Beijerinckia sp. L45]|uniref:acetate/propionate family kinase n=1 Tax=Beijerinckia sp. L45 TaxID=1641855 RepID=UPI00131B759E|nr:acetate/propionate family kinase [Beijerinckia sp. L45]